MVNISPAEILKILGKWTRSGEYSAEVAKRNKLSLRYAHMLIKKDKQVLKLVLDNRAIIYGLAEFGPPTEPKTTVKTHAHAKSARCTETAMLPNPNLDKEEREQYRLDIEYLALIKQFPEGFPKDSEWAEWFKHEEDKFKLKWGIVKTE